MTNGGYYRLRQKIYSLALPIVIEKAEINHSLFLQDVMQSGDITKYSETFASLKNDSEYNKYRYVCLDLVDVEFQIRRVNTILTLLQLPSVPQLTLNEWTHYHYDYWSLAMYGLLERFKQLSKHVTRHLIKPNNSRWQIIEGEVLASVKALKSKVAKIRDPIAHCGGAVEAIDEDNILPLYILAGGSINHIETWFGTESHQEKWATRLLGFTKLALEEIDTACDRLLIELH